MGEGVNTLCYGARLKEMRLLGMNIVAHPLARDVRIEFKVMRWATRKKKRKNWRVMRIEINRPGCYQVGNTLYMHPDLIAKLPREACSQNYWLSNTIKA